MRKPRRVKTPTRRKATTAKTTRSKARTSNKTSASTSSKQRTGFDRGAVGFKKGAAKREQQQREYEKRKNTPWDFRLAPGDEAEVIILDTEEPFFITEHTLKINGRWGKEVCIADRGDRCPLCESLGKEGSYTMYLTVLDRRPYKIKKGPNAGKTIKASRKLLPVKGRNMAKFERQYKKNKGN